MLFPVQDRGKHILEDSQRIAVVIFLPDKFFKETGTAACMAGCGFSQSARKTAKREPYSG